MSTDAPALAGAVTGNDVDAIEGTPGNEPGWSWPPYAPWEPVDGERFALDEWAPASTVRRPWLRVGRWTLLYRRSA